MSDDARVFIIDDDDAVRYGLRMLLEAVGLTVQDHARARTFLEQCSTSSRGCVISDIQMPEIDGLQLQAMLKQRGIRLPLIMLTGHGDVPAAVKALKAGAIDFIEKPFDPDRLLAQVRIALALDVQRHAASARESHRAHLFARLTPREQEVIGQIAHGGSNKLVAAQLGISERTVELHRARGMRKLELRNVAELAQFVGPAQRRGDADRD